MLKALLRRDGWIFDGTRWRKDLIFHGDTYCICPGIPKHWDSLLNVFLKGQAYTSEQNIDWWSEHIISRQKGITRGAIYTFDPWIFERCIKTNLRP